MNISIGKAEENNIIWYQGPHNYKGPIYDGDKKFIDTMNGWETQRLRI